MSLSNYPITQINMELDYVVKRDGRKEEMRFDKILTRIKNLSDELKINPSRVTQKVCSMIYPNINTSELDELAGQVCSSLATEHPDYGVLASRIIISNHHKNTYPSFSETIAKLFSAGLINDELKSMVDTYANKINDVIDYNRDYLIDYFGFKTLERSYLMRVKGTIVERPQHLFMRVALAINLGDIRGALDTYDLCSNKYYTHATPTLFNAGTKRQQLSSCFLLAMKDDSIDGIFATLKDCAMISKWAGGIGLHIHNIRAKNSHIQGTNGISNGIVPMLRVFNNTARYVDQCVLPDTMIYSTKGPLKICDVVVNDTEVYNQTGNVEVVENVLEHSYDGEILTIDTTHSLQKLTITPEHPVLVLQKQSKGLNYDVIRNRLDKKIANVEWVEAKNIACGDMIAYSIPKYDCDISHITPDDCYMYGVILGDGYMNPTDKNGYISLNKTTKESILTSAQNYFNNKLVAYRTETYDNTTRVYWCKSVNIPFKYSDIYDTHKDKICNSRWLNLPLDKAKMILKGLVDTDGCKANEVVFDNTSYNLIEAVRFLCLRMGVLTSGYVRNRVGESHVTSSGRTITNKKISYCLRIPKTPEIIALFSLDEQRGQFVKFFRYENYLFSRVRGVTSSIYSGSLYDLQMSKQHNYMLHQGLVHNGGGKRNGSIAIYLEPWHRDIMDFLLLRKNHGTEEERARDLFYSMWMPDLFMERVEADGVWTLFCPNECPGLDDVVGEEFRKLYLEYETSGKGTEMKARELWNAILESQIETGTPYICYKDASNLKSNQQNLGTIKSSNLCTEIVEYSSKDESAVCNLASIGLSNFVETNESGDNFFNYEKLHEVTGLVTNNLNKVIDINYYPIPEARKSNTSHRPIGIGVQGLADVFAMLKIPFDSPEATDINERIFATIYHAALEKSMKLAKERTNILSELVKLENLLGDISLNFDSVKRKAMEQECLAIRNSLNPLDIELNRSSHLGSYSSFLGSPASRGELQFDLWKETAIDMYNWNHLREEIKTYGLRNSLLVAPMPTASTSQILGNNECIEPFTSNIYLRRTLAGEFIVINRHLIRALLDLNLWSEELKNDIIRNNGSIAHIQDIPEYIRAVYKTVWEIGNKPLIDMAATRGKYICQSQSLNLFMDKPTFQKLSSMHFYAWRKGLKTGIYYLRTKAVAQAQQFTIEPDKKESVKAKNGDAASQKPLILACSLDNPDCEACGS